jgi:hypothetical protein
MRDESSASEKNPDKKPERPSDANPIDPLPHHREPNRDPKPGRPYKNHTAGGKQPDAAASKDISHALKGWDYESGTINVRKVAGADGTPKLQMRLDLGLLQMELTGRPDGAQPHGCESLLDYFEEALKDHDKRNGTKLGFHLTGEQCQSLREEAVMYYHRYLSLFVLGEFAGVVRDTARNLRLLDFCGNFAVEEQDRLILEQYRPYIIMMNVRAAAMIQFKARQYAAALATIDGGLKSIRRFFARFEQEEAYGQCNEVKVLRKFAKDIRRKLPVDPVRKLQGKLDRAIKDERYEDAATLRDQISELTFRKNVGP